MGKGSVGFARRLISVNLPLLAYQGGRDLSARDLRLIAGYGLGLPPPTSHLDSHFRGNDENQNLPLQSLSRGKGFVARDLRLIAGDGLGLPAPRPIWIPAFAGMTGLESGKMTELDSGNDGVEKRE